MVWCLSVVCYAVVVVWLVGRCDIMCRLSMVASLGVWWVWRACGASSMVYISILGAGHVWKCHLARCGQVRSGFCLSEQDDIALFTAPV